MRSPILASPIRITPIRITPARITPARLAPALLALAALSAHAQVQYTTIALTGKPAPGLPSINYGTLSDPRLSDTFAVAFWSQLVPNIAINLDNALWVDRGNGPVLVARESDPLPAPGIFGLPSPQLSSGGLISLSFALIQNPVGSLRVAFAAQPTINDPVAIIDTEPPQIPAAGLNFSFPIPRTDDGQSAYLISPRSPTPAVIRTNAGNITVGDPAPTAGTTLPVGSLFRRFSPPVMNTNGDMVFRAWAGDQTDAATWRQGIWKLTAGSLAPVAIVAEGDATPDDEITFRDMTATPRLDDSGRVAFQSRVLYHGLSKFTGLYRWDSGIITRLILVGRPIEGGLTAGNINANFAATSAGDLAVLVPVAEGTPAANAVILRIAADNTQSIAIREGDPAPGLALGAIRTLGEPQLSSAGGLAFTATISNGTPVTATLFAQARAGTSIFPINSIGETFTPPTGAAKVIRDLSFAHDPQPSGVAQFVGRSLVYKLSFADESCALLRADLPAPDPIADINLDGQLTLEDFFAFFNAFDASLPPADIDGLPGVTLEDFFAFFNSWDS